MTHCTCKFGVSKACPRHGQMKQARLEVLTTVVESQEFKNWFAKHHPFDWWAKERNGVSLPHFDRILVRKLCATTYEAALNAERERCAKVIDNEIETLRSIKYPTAHTVGEIQDLVRIAAKIRGGNSNAD